MIGMHESGFNFHCMHVATILIMGDKCNTIWESLFRDVGCAVTSSMRSGEHDEVTRHGGIGSGEHGAIYCKLKAMKGWMNKKTRDPTSTQLQLSLSLHLSLLCSALV